MTHLLLAAGAVDPARVKPGWLGLLVVLAIAVAVVVLWRSMNRQLGKVDFDEGGADGDGPGAEADHEADKPS
jgi:hypothetical protein